LRISAKAVFLHFQNLIDMEEKVFKAQVLTATGNKLFYHTWPTESGKHNYEVDFLLSRGTKLWPLEVKSSGYKSHASLDAFCEKFSNRVGERFLVYTKDYCRDGVTTLLPVVMTMFL